MLNWALTHSWCQWKELQLQPPKSAACAAKPTLGAAPRSLRKGFCPKSIINLGFSSWEWDGTQDKGRNLSAHGCHRQVKGWGQSTAPYKAQSGAAGEGRQGRSLKAGNKKRLLFSPSHHMLEWGSNACTYVQLNKFTEGKIHQGPLTNVFPLAHKFPCNRLLEGYIEGNMCIHSYTIPVPATVHHRSESEQPFLY